MRVQPTAVHPFFCRDPQPLEASAYSLNERCSSKNLWRSPSVSVDIDSWREKVIAKLEGIVRVSRESLSYRWQANSLAIVRRHYFIEERWSADDVAAVVCRSVTPTSCSRSNLAETAFLCESIATIAGLWKEKELIVSDCRLVYNNLPARRATDRESCEGSSRAEMRFLENWWNLGG